mmetsp:Transcript_99341/g.170996  ORF Transcript_99341/g.170996 Transcript_99341/m.170996 type:complete len:213 (+) Transcript_99341:2348-2986(+)
MAVEASSAVRTYCTVRARDCHSGGFAPCHSQVIPSSDTVSAFSGPTSNRHCDWRPSPCPSIQRTSRVLCLVCRKASAKGTSNSSTNSCTFSECSCTLRLALFSLLDHMPAAPDVSSISELVSASIPSELGGCVAQGLGDVPGSFWSICFPLCSGASPFLYRQPMGLPSAHSHRFPSEVTAIDRPPTMERRAFLLSGSGRATTSTHRLTYIPQ